MKYQKPGTCAVVYMCVGSRGWSIRNQERVLSCVCVMGVEDEVSETRNGTTAHVPGFWYFILYTQHTYTRQHTFLVSGTSSSTPNTHIHDSTRSWFLVLHPLLPTHIYTTAHVPCFWYFILYSQHTYTRQHTFLVSGTSSSTPNTHIHDSTRSWYLVLHPLLPTHIYPCRVYVCWE
jgi:hypothetical protein